VLIENGGKGHTDNFAPVTIEGAARGQTGQARIVGRNGDNLTAAWA
jgi:threonylcarbamoyladenosine tRNA methylthiotransferase MtaB